MSLTITSNVLSLQAQRRASAAGEDIARTISRLSSGMRVSSAADDAAGMAIAQRMTSNMNGLNMAGRNINDAASMLQVADSAMAQVTENLQRLRQLAVQGGASTYAQSDREALQQEAREILAHISQIGSNTEFNGDAVFSQDLGSIGGDKGKRAVIDGLKSSGWLTQSEKLISKYYGIQGDGADLRIDLDALNDGPSNVLAFVAWPNLMMALDMSDFTLTNGADGGDGLDRIVAHEMVHAVMYRETGMNLPGWFIEGAAELIHGADDRVRGATNNGATAATTAFVADFENSVYAGGFAATRYMHDKLKDMGVEGGIKGIMTYLGNNRGNTLTQALNVVTNGAIATEAAFVADFKANGVAYVQTVMNLTNADTGAIGGLDADGGLERTARSVIADGSDRPPDQPLAGFNVVFPETSGTTATRKVQVQVGANATDHIEISLSAMNAGALGLDDLDLRRTSVAIRHIDEALAFVSNQRVAVGASSKRLEIAASAAATGTENLAASRSRIVDTDYAAETAALTRAQILQQAANAMVAQANNQPRTVLSLLR
ncbi:flagellinolysin [Massilia sp. RP-1-19]|uniref:Flagellin n=1 Tax=Massilia polaris TaxID=2728846 RepID=A0A848HI80_9BURK|nr:flagellinolysin [Massilia polaris]NML59900.1 flagellinolysin [Massilia polaris]